MLRTTAVTKGSLVSTAPFLPIFPEGPLTHADAPAASPAREGVPKIPPWFDVTNFTRTQLGGIAAMPTIAVAQAYAQGITGVSVSSGSMSGGISAGSMHQHVAGNQTADELTLRRAVGALQSNVSYQVEWALKLLLIKSYGEDVFFSESGEINGSLMSAEDRKVRHKMVLSILFNLLVGNKNNLTEAPKEDYFIDYLCSHFKNDLNNGDIECFRIDLDIMNVISYFIPFEIKDSFIMNTLFDIFINYNSNNDSNATNNTKLLVNDSPIMSSVVQTLASFAAAGYNDKWFAGVPHLYEKVASLIVLNSTERANKAPLLRLCCHVCRISSEACTAIASSQLVPRALVLEFREFVEMISVQEELSSNISDHGRTITSVICFVATHCQGSFAVFEHFFAYLAASETVHPAVSAYAGFICAAIFKSKQ